MASLVLKLSGLTKTYKRVHLLKKQVNRGVDALDLEIQQGEVFGLLGLNGSGKTTAIKLILGLLFPTKGTVEVFDQPATHADVQKRIGFLPETPSFFRNLTVVEILSMLGVTSGLDPATLHSSLPQVLETVHLQDQKNKYVRELSKGMMQRLGLAQAILHDPDLLILDEPVTGLDPLGIHQTRQLIAKLSQKGKTVFFSSHSISELEHLANRVGIMHEGRLVCLVNRGEWQNDKGRLEDLFLETLKREGVQF